jgi:hypothetical protein
MHMPEEMPFNVPSAPPERTPPTLHPIEGGKPEAEEVTDDQIEIVEDDGVAVDERADESPRLVHAGYPTEEQHAALGRQLAETTAEKPEDQEIAAYERSDEFKSWRQQWDGKTVRVMDNQAVSEGWKVIDVFVKKVSADPNDPKAKKMRVKIRVIKAVDPSIDPKGKNRFRYLDISPDLLAQFNPEVK